MKKLFHGLIMCQSMFCAVPIPCKTWDEEARPWMLVFLPLVGLEMGALWAACAWLCHNWGLPNLLTGVLLCAFPYVISGFIHLDGFMDVSDAIGSCRDLEKRRAILKDSHVGAFAVIGLALVLLVGFAAMASAKGSPWVLMLVPVISRCCSALAVTGLKPMSQSQYAGSYRPREAWPRLLVLGAILVLALGLGFWFWGKQALVLVAGFFGSVLALGRGYQSLDGMNGDISGYAITWSELCAAFVWALI